MYAIFGGFDSKHSTKCPTKALACVLSRLSSLPTCYLRRSTWRRYQVIEGMYVVSVKRYTFRPVMPCGSPGIDRCCGTKKLLSLSLEPPDLFCGCEIPPVKCILWQPLRERNVYYIILGEARIFCFHSEIFCTYQVEPLLLQLCIRFT